MSPQVLVDGVGNVFLGDDGFGVALARRLGEEEIADGVAVGDYGISGMHLAYDLVDSYERLILLDATARGEEPGTVTVLDVDPSDPDFGGDAAVLDSPERRCHRRGEHEAPLGADMPSAGAPPDAHGMQPDAVLGLLGQLGGRVEQLLVVGCEPASLSEEMTLSPEVEAAVERAVPLVVDLARRVRDEPHATTVSPTTTESIVTNPNRKEPDVQVRRL
jgi:hydrogenase maturation protease